jgi:tetratricopeptide (TPR) repeat protein
MKRWMALLALTAVGAAQDRMADTLRKGVVEEESKRNLSAAIQDYQTVLAQFDEVRQTAATALFRMAECYRKNGNAPQAIAAYQRVVREFGDQGQLAKQSRAVLSGTYHAPAEASEPNLSEDDKQQIAKTQEARKRYRATIEQEMDLVRHDMALVENNRRSGMTSEFEVDQYKLKLIQLERELAAFDAGMPTQIRR